jgi:hypothetical protein
MRNFTVEDFKGAGQYLVRTTEDFVARTGYLTTIMYKVGYMHGEGRKGQKTLLISMADGWSNDRTILTKDEEGNKIMNSSGWVVIPWVTDKEANPPVNNKQLFVDYLNKHAEQEYRFATQEEIVRVVSAQYWRWRTTHFDESFSYDVTSTLKKDEKTKD